MEFHTIDGETFSRKRDRRVSFSETTTVHLFDRDDSLVGSPKSDNNATLSPCSDSGGDDSSRDTRDDGDDDEDDDENEDEGEDEEGLPVPPVRFAASMIDSSPGSASVASVASNDDDNFFGSVSRSFMESGMVSDSGMSADNNNVTHDITLDSTSFSLHFRNIGGDDRSANSAGSILTTPSLDNKTPFVRGGINELSGANDLVARLKFSGTMSSAGLGDFSFAANNSRKYDYGRMSATLNDLLCQVDDCIKTDSSVSHPIDVQMDQKVDDSTLNVGEVSHPTDASVDQNGDGAKLLTGADPHSVDVSTDKNGHGAKPLLEEVARPIDVSLDKNGESARSLMGEVSGAVDVSIDKNGDNAKPSKEETSYPVNISMDQNGGVKLLTGENSHSVYHSIDKFDVGQVDVSMDRNNDGARVLKGEDPHKIDVSIDNKSDGAKLVTAVVSVPVDVPMVQNVDCGMLMQREHPHQVDVSIDKNSNVSELITGEVSFPVDVSSIQNGDGAKLLQKDGYHPTDVSSDKNDNSAKLVTGEGARAIDVPMEENVNYTPAFDDKPVSESNEGHSKDSHRDLQSNIITHSQVTAMSSPQKTTPVQVESAIPLSSPVTTVQYPETKFPIVTPKVSAQTSSCTKMTQLNKTCQSSDIRAELFKHSERISAINESILRDFLKDNITSTRLDFGNENLPPPQLPVQRVVSNQEFNLEGRKRKLQQFLRSMEDRPAKHAKLLVHSSQEHGEKPQNCNLDWNKLTEDMSEITRVSFSPSVQKLSIQELGLLSGMMEKIQTARKYERLSACLKNCDSADQRQRRLAEARSLHDKLLCEKAKLELNRLKLNKLRIKAELACQRTRECLLLKSMVSDLCHSSSKEAYTEHNCFPAKAISVSQDEEKLISKRHALKAIEQNIMNLSASFRVLYKIREDVSCDDIINIAKEHLKLKNTYNFVQRELKAWKLQDIVKQDKRCEIVLDHIFFFQRFTLGTGKSGSILVNTILNRDKTLQAFREMNAYSAIEFVFRTKSTVHNIDSSKFVRQETLEKSLLLGNVIDVLHEVQAAKGELLNLVSTNFNCNFSNTNKLELQLCFMNFKWGKKVVLSLDMSDLKFGMYPSEPSELHIEVDPTMTTFDELCLKEIKALVQRLPTGRLIILRFCRAVSQYVHSYM